ncbi:hypothetical protein GGR20_003086 [Devosia subaequoris]|uniref:DUF1801 domain-containing protein n=1 Tax=Devosia subaequoris TaxID=395930 RepID=A0A7W6ND67_9HYPH|nr:DUF1801 domain-containing protein [Devosia subaequoris]MBB4053426.1 hypothetical protein [Devosia subaequoris]MCP1210803.1 DUF1801 domain-containing protein [Devosia subaequoris]
MNQAELDTILAQQPESARQLCHDVVRLLENVAGLAGSVKLGWRSVNFRHDVAGLVCAVFPHEDRVAIYFENGRQLEDADGLLQGSHLKKGRFLWLYPGEPVPETAIVMLVAEAVALKL